MQKLVRVFVFVLVAALGCGAATVEDLNWFVGKWVGDMGGAPIREVWIEPDGGAMMGMFQVSKDGTASLFEFMTITAEGDNLVMKLRHFRPGLIAWEDKETPVSFRLTELTGKKAVFTQEDAPTKMIYERKSDTEFLFTLERERDGQTTTREFPFRRAN